jgi:CO dehydrogenase/acetyl-CoA synthase delta subunit
MCNLTIGPVEDKNHKGIGAAAMGYGHTVISSSPIDVNLAKQVNILLENLGMPMDGSSLTPPPAAWDMAWNTATRSWNASEWLP